MGSYKKNVIFSTAKLQILGTRNRHYNLKLDFNTQIILTNLLVIMSCRLRFTILAIMNLDVVLTALICRVLLPKSAWVPRD